MKIIELTKGYQAFVDDEDFERLSEHSWHFSAGYARSSKRMSKTGNQVLMHRFILGELYPQYDHVNGNKLDNQKANLRPCTSSQNGANRNLMVNNKSGYYGVSKARNTSNKTWKAQITWNGKVKSIGYFLTPEEAALAYNKMALRLHKEFAKLNVIKESA